MIQLATSIMLKVNVLWLLLMLIFLLSNSADTLISRMVLVCMNSLSLEVCNCEYRPKLKQETALQCTFRLFDMYFIQQF